MEGGKSRETSHEGGGLLWGKAFAWVIRGAAAEKVWAITGDFVHVDSWMRSLVQSSALAEGQPETPGCVRRPVLYPASPGQPFTFALEKLLLMDAPSHHYIYAIIGGTLPGFSLMQGYVSSFKLSSLPSSCAEYEEEHATLLQWSFTCHPVSTLSEQDAHNVAFSLYEAAINDLKTQLALPDGSVTLLD